nr:hypothetical protein [Tanacetum cinerariifolium]
MDLFGPTSVSSISHKWYCLVVTDDFSRFTWTFFLKSKDETSGILKKFITEIENLKDLKVKIIKCDNGGEFRNKEINDFCSQKGIKREFSNARTPQQNGFTKRRNRALIEAARTMVLVYKSHNKTPYELFNGDEGYFIGYSMSSKAFKVFNKITRRVEENMHVEFLENKAIEKGAGPNWLFDIDSLTKSINYMPVDAGTIPTKISGTKDATSQEVKKNVSSLRYIALPNWAHDALLESSSSKPQDHCSAEAPEGSGNPNLTASTSNPPADPMETLTVETSIPTACSPNVWTLVDCPKGVRPIGTKWVLKNKMDVREIVIRNKARLVAQGHTQEEGIDYDEVFAPVARIEAIRLLLAYASFMGFTVYQMDVKSAFLYGTIDEEVYAENLKPLCIKKFQMSAMGELNFFLGLQVLQKEDGIFLSQDKYVGDILKKFGYSEVRSSNTPMDKENPWGKDGTEKDVDIYLYRSMIGSLMYLTLARPDIMFVVCACARHQVTPKECHLHAVKRIFRYLKGHLKLRLWYPKESHFDLVAYSDSDYGGATQDRKSTTEGEFEALMHEKFQMSAMGELNFFLGLQVLQKGKDETGKDVDLHLYRSMIGSLMYLTASRPDIMFAVCACARHQVTPKESYLDSDYGGASQDHKSTTGGSQFLGRRSMIGSLMYLTASRPDIMFAVCACARNQMTPKECHLHAVKRIFRYLKGRLKLGLWYPKESPFDLVAYSDSDYGGATQDHKLTARGCQFLARRLISWQCKKQTIVATSTTEAEYVAAASYCGQVLWIQNQLLDYGLSMPCEALSREFSTSILRLNKMHKAFPLLVRKSPLPEGTSHYLKMNATVRRIQMPLPEVCIAIEEKKKKLP